MKSVVFSFQDTKMNTMVVSTKIARFVADHLKLPLVDKEISEHKNLDVLLIVNGAYKFCKWLPETAEAVRTAKRVVWIQNDYTIIPPKTEGEAESPFRVSFRERHAAGLPPIDYWSTVRGPNQSGAASTYVNWNCMTFDTDSDRGKLDALRQKADRKDALVYFGAFRNNSGKSSRLKYFDRYFQKPGVPTFISSPSDKFAEAYPKCQHEEKVGGDLTPYLARHGAGLYIEDRKTHEVYCSPANRFYEMLSAGLPMLFQPESGTMMRKAGYNPEGFYASNAKEIQRFLQSADEHRKLQLDQWYDKARTERKNLPDMVALAWHNTRKHL